MTTIRTPRPTGPEFRVNTTTSPWDQDSLAVAPLADGGFVAAWEVRSRPSGDFDIYAQRFGADGAPAGGEFRANATTVSVQTDPAMAALADGGFVVSWTGWYGPGGADADVWAQRYAADGAPVGGEFRANATVANNQYDPAIAALADGGFVASWVGSSQANGDDRNIYAQRYAADGSAVGGEFRVNAAIVGDASDPLLFGLAGGGFVASWSTFDPATYRYDLYLRCYAADGAPTGGEFRVDATGPGDLARPAMAALADGGFLLLGVSYHAPTGERDVRVRRYAADGAPLGGEISIGIALDGSQDSPAISALADGGFVVSWPDYDRASGDAILARRFAADGTPVDDAFRVKATVAKTPELATLAGDEFVAFWTDGAADLGIHAQRFTVPALASEVAIARTGPARVEGDAGSTALTFTVSLDIASATEQRVQWRTIDHGGSPAGPDDFAGGARPSGTLVFASGETSKVITVNVAGDASDEPDETFAVRLENPSAGLAIGGGGVATGAIINDELPAVRGTAGDDTFLRTSGRVAYEGSEGRDTLELEPFGIRQAVVAAQPDGRAYLANASVSALLGGIEEVRFADGRLVFDATDPAARVLRLYEAALDRLPDQGGLNFWIGAVQNGRPLAELAQGFLGSAEFAARFGDVSGNGALVDRLYQNVLGRAGEAEGRQYWMGVLERGAAGRADVLAAFSESAENQAGTAVLVRAGIWDRSEAATQVARLYDTVFGRLPDAEGLIFWKNALEGGTATLAQMAGAFTSSAEFRAKYDELDNWDFAEALYRNSLDRSPGYSEMIYWEDRLDAGVSRTSVVLAFSESAEHAALTAANIQSENPAEFGILFA